MQVEKEELAEKVEEMDGDDENEEDPLGFLIQDTDFSVHMRNIPPYFSPNFLGMRSEDAETFLFEFEIVCRPYGYLLNTKNLRLFPTTLKDRSLKWFMSLETNSIGSWNDMCWYHPKTLFPSQKHIIYPYIFIIYPSKSLNIDY